MTVPARESAAGQDPPHSRRKPDPMSPGWANVQQALACAVQALVLAVGELRDDDAGPGSPALEMAGKCLTVVENLGEMARRWQVDEATLAAECRQAYARGVADAKAARCRLSAVPGA